MVVSSTSSDKSLDANWSTQLVYVNWFRNAIDYLEAEDCASGDLVTEARKKIDEATELITAIVEGHDKDKQDKAKDLINEIRQAFFTMLDNCYNKYAGPRMSQMSKSQG
jgi:pyrroloquinoline quinone (PQQ) biosynthesis protein C